jgi:hypothetical protein
VAQIALWLSQNNFMSPAQYFYFVDVKAKLLRQPYRLAVARLEDPGFAHRASLQSEVYTVRIYISTPPAKQRIRTLNCATRLHSQTVRRLAGYFRKFGCFSPADLLQVMMNAARKLEELAAKLRHVIEHSGMEQVELEDVKQWIAIRQNREVPPVDPT